MNTDSSFELTTNDIYRLHAVIRVLKCNLGSISTDNWVETIAALLLAAVNDLGRPARFRTADSPRAVLGDMAQAPKHVQAPGIQLATEVAMRILDR